MRISVQQILSCHVFSADFLYLKETMRLSQAPLESGVIFQQQVDERKTIAGFKDISGGDISIDYKQFYNFNLPPPPLIAQLAQKSFR